MAVSSIAAAARMRVKIFDDVLIDGAECFAFRGECDIAECFPDDPDGLELALAAIERDGAAWIGGGAAPLVVLERVR